MSTASMMDSLTSAGEGETGEAEIEPQLEHDAEQDPEEQEGEQEEAEAPAPAAPAKATPEQIANNLQAALRESRAEQKAMREELAALRAKLNEQPKPPVAEPEKDPDFLEDPKGYVDAKEKKLMEQLSKTQEENKKTQAQQQQEQERQQLLSQTLAHEQQFVASTPDYPQALEHIRNTRSAQLRVIHPEATPEQIAGQIAFEEMTFAKQIIAAGKNPAEFAYNYAQAMGYKKPKPTPKANGSRAEARTLGSSGGTDDGGEHNHRGAKDGISEFGSAKAERFRKRAN